MIDPDLPARGQQLEQDNVSAARIISDSACPQGMVEATAVDSDHIAAPNDAVDQNSAAAEAILEQLQCTSPETADVVMEEHSSRPTTARASDAPDTPPDFTQLRDVQELQQPSLDQVVDHWLQEVEAAFETQIREPHGPCTSPAADGVQADAGRSSDHSKLDGVLENSTLPSLPSAIRPDQKGPLDSAYTTVEASLFTPVARSVLLRFPAAPHVGSDHRNGGAAEDSPLNLRLAQFCLYLHSLIPPSTSLEQASKAFLALVGRWPIQIVDAFTRAAKASVHLMVTAFETTTSEATSPIRKSYCARLIFPPVVHEDEFLCFVEKDPKSASTAILRVVVQAFTFGAAKALAPSGDPAGPPTDSGYTATEVPWANGLCKPPYGGTLNSGLNCSNTPEEDNQRRSEETVGGRLPCGSGIVTVSACRPRFGSASDVSAGLLNPTPDLDGPPCGKESSEGTVPTTTSNSNSSQDEAENRFSFSNGTNSVVAEIIGSGVARVDNETVVLPAGANPTSTTAAERDDTRSGEMRNRDFAAGNSQYDPTDEIAIVDIANSPEPEPHLATDEEASLKQRGKTTESRVSNCRKPVGAHCGVYRCDEHGLLGGFPLLSQPSSTTAQLYGTLKDVLADINRSVADVFLLEVAKNEQLPNNVTLFYFLVYASYILRFSIPYLTDLVLQAPLILAAFVRQTKPYVLFHLSSSTSQSWLSSFACIMKCKCQMSTDEYELKAEGRGRHRSIVALLRRAAQMLDSIGSVSFSLVQSPEIISQQSPYDKLARRSTLSTLLSDVCRGLPASVHPPTSERHTKWSLSRRGPFRDEILNLFRIVACCVKTCVPSRECPSGYEHVGSYRFLAFLWRLDETGLWGGSRLELVHHYGDHLLASFAAHGSSNTTRATLVCERLDIEGNIVEQLHEPYDAYRVWYDYTVSNSYYKRHPIYKMKRFVGLHRNRQVAMRLMIADAFLASDYLKAKGEFGRYGILQPPTAILQPHVTDSSGKVYASMDKLLVLIKEVLEHGLLKPSSIFDISADVHFELDRSYPALQTREFVPSLPNPVPLFTPVDYQQDSVRKIISASPRRHDQLGSAELEEEHDEVMSAPDGDKLPNTLFRALINFLHRLTRNDVGHQRALVDLALQMEPVLVENAFVEYCFRYVKPHVPNLASPIITIDGNEGDAWEVTIELPISAPDEKRFSFYGEGDTKEVACQRVVLDAISTYYRMTGREEVTKVADEDGSSDILQTTATTLISAAQLIKPSLSSFVTGPQVTSVPQTGYFPKRPMNLFGADRAETTEDRSVTCSSPPETQQMDGSTSGKCGAGQKSNRRRRRRLDVAFSKALQRTAENWQKRLGPAATNDDPKRNSHSLQQSPTAGAKRGAKRLDVAHHWVAERLESGTKRRKKGVVSPRKDTGGVASVILLSEKNDIGLAAQSGCGSLIVDVARMDSRAGGASADSKSADHGENLNDSQVGVGHRNADKADEMWMHHSRRIPAVALDVGSAWSKSLYADVGTVEDIHNKEDLYSVPDVTTFTVTLEPETNLPHPVLPGNDLPHGDTGLAARASFVVPNDNDVCGETTTSVDEFDMDAAVDDGSVLGKTAVITEKRTACEEEDDAGCPDVEIIEEHAPDQLDGSSSGSVEEIQSDTEDEADPRWNEYCNAARSVLAQYGCAGDDDHRVERGNGPLSFNQFRMYIRHLDVQYGLLSGQHVPGISFALIVRAFTYQANRGSVFAVQQKLAELCDESEPSEKEDVNGDDLANGNDAGIWNACVWFRDFIDSPKSSHTGRSRMFQASGLTENEAVRSMVHLALVDEIAAASVPSGSVNCSNQEELDHLNFRGTDLVGGTLLLPQCLPVIALAAAAECCGSQHENEEAWLGWGSATTTTDGGTGSGYDFLCHYLMLLDRCFNPNHERAAIFRAWGRYILGVFADVAPEDVVQLSWTAKSGRRRTSRRLQLTLLQSSSSPSFTISGSGPSSDAAVADLLQEASREVMQSAELYGIVL